MSVTNQLGLFWVVWFLGGSHFCSSAVQLIGTGSVCVLAADLLLIFAVLAL